MQRRLHDRLHRLGRDRRLRAAALTAANRSCGPRPPTKSSPKLTVKSLQTRDTRDSDEGVKIRATPGQFSGDADMLFCPAFIGLVIALSDSGPEHPRPTAASGDLAQLLDINVDQVTASCGVNASDDAARGTVQPAQFGQPVTGEDSITLVIASSTSAYTLWPSPRSGNKRWAGLKPTKDPRGKSHEATRCPKRRLSAVIHRRLVRDASTPKGSAPVGLTGATQQVQRGQLTCLHRHFGPVTHRASQSGSYNQQTRTLDIERRHSAGRDLRNRPSRNRYR